MAWQWEPQGLREFSQFARRKAKVLPLDPPKTTEPGALIEFGRYLHQEAVIEFHVVGDDQVAGFHQSLNPPEIQAPANQVSEWDAVHPHGDRIYRPRSGVLKSRVTIHRSE